MLQVANARAPAAPAPLQAVLHFLVTVATAAAQHRVSLFIQLRRFLLRTRRRLPHAVAANMPLPYALLNMHSFDAAASLRAPGSSLGGAAILGLRSSGSHTSAAADAAMSEAALAERELAGPRFLPRRSTSRGSEGSVNGPEAAGEQLGLLDLEGEGEGDDDFYLREGDTGDSGSFAGGSSGPQDGEAGGLVRRPARHRPAGTADSWDAGGAGSVFGAHTGGHRRFGRLSAVVEVAE